MDKPSDFEELITSLERLRDELKLKIHLAAADARDEVRPSGIPGIRLRLAAGLFEDASDEGNAARLVAGRVRRVEPDQLLQELCGSH